jgi:hypothetical protein
MSQLNNNDYKKILEFYEKTIPKSKRLIKKAAEEIMGQKLCKCIKKVGPPEECSIGICTKIVINNKRYTRGKFKCKGKSSNSLKKSTQNKTKNIEDSFIL